MNPELQKSLQVTVLPNGLDGYMLVILLIMIAAGVLGGVANYFLSERGGNPPTRSDWTKYPILGVIAALTVPLFLNMISSNLLEAARTRPVDYFVFAGFCLIYVVASRRVFENLAGKLIGQMDQMKREMVQIKNQRQDTAVLREESLSPAEMTSQIPLVKPEVVKESLSYNDIEILRALVEENYVYGNLAGLTDKTGLARDFVSARLTVLKSLGIIETRINDKNVLHWTVSARGKQMLGDILSGQEEH